MVHRARAYGRVPQRVLNGALSHMGPECLPQAFSFLHFAMTNGETDLIWTTTNPVSNNAPLIYRHNNL